MRELRPVTATAKSKGSSGPEHSSQGGAGTVPDFLSVTRRLVSTTISTLLFLFTAPPGLFGAGTLRVGLTHSACLGEAGRPRLFVSRLWGREGSRRLQRATVWLWLKAILPALTLALTFIFFSPLQLQNFRLCAFAPGTTMRPAEDASNERGGQYTGRASEVLPACGIFSELFLNALMSSRDTHLYEFGPFVLNTSERTLLRDGRRVPLRPKLFNLLLVLVENSGRLVEKDELMRTVWQGRFVEEGNINKTVSMLRQALGEDPALHQYIETVPTLGYRFVAEVRTAGGGGDAELVVETQTRAGVVFEEVVDDEPAADGAALLADAAVTKMPGATETVETAAPVAALHAGKSERRLKSWALPAAAAVIVALAATGYLFFFKGGGEPIDSVAVLPFVNEGGDPEVEYLSDGISESLINSLSQLPKLKVIARSSSFKYKGREVDPRDAARTMGAAAILTGRVARRGDDLLISVELVDARDNTHVWGEQYNHEFSDIFQAQDEIAKEIVERLRLKLSSEQEKLLTKHYTENTEAYKLYLQGRYYGSKWTEEGWKKSLEYYNRAIDIDPNYALAYTGLSSSYVLLGLFGAMPQKDAYPRGKAAALKALQLDDSLAEAHAALGDVKELYDWDFAGAKGEIKRAIEINPNDADIHQTYGYHFIHMGQFDEAITEMRRAVELDPLTVENLASLADAYIYARQPDQAIEQCKKALEMDQNYSEAHFFLARALEQKGMYQEAITEFQKAIALSDGSPEALSGLGHAYAVSGKRDKAQKVIDDLKEQSTRRYIDPGLIAIIHAGRGEKDEAFRWLEKAYEDRSSLLVHAKAEPELDSLRSDQRFQDLLRRVGLAHN